MKYPPFLILIKRELSDALFLDPGALSTPAPEEVELGATNLTNLVQGDRLDMRGCCGEGTFYTHAIGYLPNGKGSGSSLSLTLDHIPLEALDTLLVAFNDLIINCHIVSGLELGEGGLGGQLFVYKGYGGVHKLQFWTAKVCLLVISAKIFSNWS